MFNDGFKNFVKGDWRRARKMFRQVEQVKRAADRPTEVLMEFMAETNYEAPDDWLGYRK